MRIMESGKAALRAACDEVLVALNRNFGTSLGPGGCGADTPACGWDAWDAMTATEQNEWTAKNESADYPAADDRDMLHGQNPTAVIPYPDVVRTADPEVLERDRIIHETPDEQLPDDAHDDQGGGHRIVEDDEWVSGGYEAAHQAYLDALGNVDAGVDDPAVDDGATRIPLDVIDDDVASCPADEDGY